MSLSEQIESELERAETELQSCQNARRKLALELKVKSLNHRLSLSERREARA